MSLKDIKEKILLDASQVKNRIWEDAKIKIEGIKKTESKENETIEYSILEKYRQEAELKEKKIITEARLNAKKDLLSEKQTIINNIFSETLKRIIEFDDKKYLSLIENLILENVEIGDETIYLGNQERDSINQEFIAKINGKLKKQSKRGELTISKNRLPIVGGVIIGTGQIKKNASLEVVLEKTKDEMETRLNHFLFGMTEE
ncbi:MAG TPA: V-type ATP synthase subunit E family protein [Atribacterota bacterium]|nr:V-type ATP synthase subunit E family protein [Atribacterota bacterium]HPK86445.1 V-type ATP synthase subunit E family protein [Atribacterota bacterium]